MDFDRPWGLHPQVSVRPEPFGALLYHFGTRKLTFLKDRRLLAVLQAMGNAPSVHLAMVDSGVSESAMPQFEQALQSLARSSMLVERTAS